MGGSFARRLALLFPCRAMCPTLLGHEGMQALVATLLTLPYTCINFADFDRLHVSLDNIIKCASWTRLHHSRSTYIIPHFFECMESFEGQIVSNKLAGRKQSKEFGQISLQFARGGRLPLRQYYIVGYSFPDEALTSTYCWWKKSCTTWDV